MSLSEKVTKTAIKKLGPIDENELDKYVSDAFHEASKLALNEVISKKVTNKEEKALNEFFEKVNAELNSGKNMKSAFVSALTEDASNEGPVYTTCVGCFQALQKVRGSIFESITERLLNYKSIKYIRQERRGYPDFFILDKKKKVIGFITCKVSIRERYRQAIKEKENMDAIGYGGSPFFLVTLEKEIADASRYELKQSGIFIFGSSDFEKLVIRLKSI